MPQLNYSLSIGPKFDMFGLERSTPNDCILVGDNVESDFSLITVEYDESDSFIKNIKSTTISARKTRIVANTSDLKMSDVFYYDEEDEEEAHPIHLYNKAIKRRIHKPKIYINGEKVMYSDSNFIYFNADEALIEYYTQDDELILREYQEVYPAFIWQEQINHESIIALDNKKYSFKVSKGDMIISLSKPNVHAEAVAEPVYTLNRIKKLIVKIEPFYFETLRSNDDGRLLFEYDYSVMVPDITKRRLEQNILKSEDFIDLENIDVVKESLVIYKKKDYEYEITEDNIDDEYRDYDIVLDNSTGLYNNIINSGKGQIDASVLIKENIISHNDIIFTSYQYVKTNNILKIEPEDNDLKNKKVYFRIKPTAIKKPGVSLYFPPDITYIITELNGDISLIKDDELPQYEYEVPLYLGYGKGGYSENGYSGVTDDFQTIVIDGSGLGSEYGTGWGELGYSEGPFGGSFLKDINDIQDLLDIKNNSESGMLTIATVVFVSEIRKANIFPYRDVCLADAKMQRKKLYNYNNIVWHHSIKNEPSDILNRTSLDVIETYSTIHFEPYIQFKDENKIIVEFDLSNIYNLFSPDATIKDEMVLDDTVSPVANSNVDIFSSLMPSANHKLTDIDTFAYVDGEYIYTPQNVMISSDFKKATVLLDTTSMNMQHDNIGLGFINPEITIHPSMTIKI
ncbi:MAG: hypothetical protein DRQ78_00155 [Epsilonproteobacteria bacterium]|nr:MAG: hypothetical protein DRQ78_00155 [Campylobacterota bacterium]